MNKQINHFLIWCFLLPAGVYRRFGADMAQLRAILETKLIIDDRTATGLNKVRNQHKEEDTSQATLFTMFVSLLMGLLFVASFVFDDDLTRMTFYFSLFSFMLAMMLITDFSHILIDVKDNYIILPKPVNAQTFLIARLLHIIIHMTKILIPLALPGWIAMWISRGVWGAIVFIPVMILVTMLTFAFVNALYLLIMRLFSPARINAIITSVQIIFSVIIYGGYQLLPRLISKSVIEEMDLGHLSVMWVFPTYWLGGAWVCLYSFSQEPRLIISLVLSVITPLVAVWVMVRYLAPAFFRKLSLINAGAGNEEKEEKSHKEITHSNGGLINVVSGACTSSGIERQSFLMTWRLMGRIRDFKLKVYPQIGYMVVIIAMFIIRDNGKFDAEELLEWSGRTKATILLAIYFSSLVYMSAVYQLPYYANFKAAWIYYSSPLVRPGVILQGAVKACLVRFLVPLVLILAILGISFYGPRLIPNLLFGFSNIFLASVLYSRLVFDKLPFSVSPKAAAAGQASLRTMVMLLVLPLFGVPHYFLFDFPWVLCIGSLFTIGGGLGVLFYIKSISWGYLSGEEG
jgi:ABC-2 type transport system permease protein